MLQLAFIITKNLWFIYFIIINNNKITNVFKCFENKLFSYSLNECCFVVWKMEKRKTETTNNFAIQNLNCSRGYIVCPQTYLHRVMSKVCLTASNMVFDADALVRENHRILMNIWRVWFCFSRIIILTKYILLNSPYDLFTIYSAGF